MSGFRAKLYEDEALARKWLQSHHPGGKDGGLAEEKVINRVWARQSPGAAR